MSKDDLANCALRGWAAQPGDQGGAEPVAERGVLGEQAFDIHDQAAAGDRLLRPQRCNSEAGARLG